GVPNQGIGRRSLLLAWALPLKRFRVGFGRDRIRNRRRSQLGLVPRREVVPFADVRDTLLALGLLGRGFAHVWFWLDRQRNLAILVARTAKALWRFNPTGAIGDLVDRVPTAMAAIAGNPYWNHFVADPGEVAFADTDIFGFHAVTPFFKACC